MKARDSTGGGAIARLVRRSTRAQRLAIAWGIIANSLESGCVKVRGGTATRTPRKLTIGELEHCERNALSALLANQRGNLSFQRATPAQDMLQHLLLGIAVILTRAH